MEAALLIVALASLTLNVLVYRAITQRAPEPPIVRREPTPLPDEDPLLPNVLGRPLSMTRAGIIIQRLRDGGETE